MPLEKLYGDPVITNAHINRTRAGEAFEAGATAQQIAAFWPEVWKCDSEGKIGQRYDSIYPDGRKETKYTITEQSLRELIASLEGE